MWLHLCEGDSPFISAGDFRSGYTGRHTGAIIECRLDTKLRWAVLLPERIGYLSCPGITGTKHMMKGICSSAYAFLVRYMSDCWQSVINCRQIPADGGRI